MRLPVTLPVQRSRSLAVVLVLAHLLAAAAVLPIDIPLTGKLAILASLGTSLALIRRPWPVTALVLKADGSLDLVGADGDEAAWAVEASTVVFPWLVVLRLRSAERVESLTLPVDAMGAEGHRQLRLWLRWKAISDRA